MNRPVTGGPLRAGILIGGVGRRMGQPKQLVEVQGRLLMQSAIDALGRVAQVALVGSGPVPERCRAMPRIRDAADFEGPLAGIVGALVHDPGSAWILAACDQPLLDRAAVEWLLSQRDPGRPALIPTIGERPQPFPGIYEPGFADLAQGTPQLRRITDFSALPQVHSPRVPTELEPAWSSVNRRSELEMLRASPRE